MTEVQEIQNDVFYFNNVYIEIFDLNTHFGFFANNTFRSGFQTKQAAINAAKTFVLSNNQ